MKRAKGGGKRREVSFVVCHVIESGLVFMDEVYVDITQAVQQRMQQAAESGMPSNSATQVQGLVYPSRGDAALEAYPRHLEVARGHPVSASCYQRLLVVGVFCWSPC